MVRADLLQPSLPFQEVFECRPELLRIDDQILVGLTREFSQILLGLFQREKLS